MKKTIPSLSLIAAASAALLFPACEDSGEKAGGSGTGRAAEVDPKISAVFVDTEPADAVVVSELRKSAKPGDSVTLVGKIAGALHPFTEGFATAVVSDVALQTCDLDPEDHCKTPWDACCVDPDVIADSRLTIQILGDDGRPVAQTLKGANGLRELDPIVVTGTVAEGSNEANMIVNVTGLFRRKSE